MEPNNSFRQKIIFITAGLFFVLSFSIVLAAGKQIRDKIVNITKSQIGEFYEMDSYLGGWPPGLDCSGLVSYSYKQAGVSGFESTTPKSHGPNTTRLVEMSERISRVDLLIGDLVFMHATYDKNRDGRINIDDRYTHVAIFIGNDRLIHAGSTNGVEEFSLTSWINAKWGIFESDNNYRRIKAEYWPNRDNGYVEEIVQPPPKKSWFQRAVSAVTNTVSAVANAVVNIVSNVFSSVTSAVSSVANAVVSTAKNIVSTVANTTTQVVNNAVNTVQKIVPAIATPTASTPSPTPVLSSTPSSAIPTLPADTTFTNVSPEIPRNPSLVQTISNVAQTVVSAVSTVFSAAYVAPIFPRPLEIVSQMNQALTSQAEEGPSLSRDGPSQGTVPAPAPAPTWTPPTVQPVLESVPEPPRWQQELNFQPEKDLVLEPGGSANLRVYFKNTGNTLWTDTDVFLNVVLPKEEQSPFFHSSWITQRRPTNLNNAGIGPDEPGAFFFRISVPESLEEGDYQISFKLVHQEGTEFLWIQGDSVTWNIKVLPRPAPVVALVPSPAQLEVEPQSSQPVEPEGFQEPQEEPAPQAQLEQHPEGTVPSGTVPSRPPQALPGAEVGAEQGAETETQPWPPVFPDATPAQLTQARPGGPQDTLPPDTIFNPWPTFYTTNSTSASFSFISDKEQTTFECQLDDSEWLSCVSPKNYEDLSEDSHTFKVRAVDASANADQTPSEFFWRIDLTRPILTLDSQPVSPTGRYWLYLTGQMSWDSCVAYGYQESEQWSGELWLSECPGRESCVGGDPNCPPEFLAWGERVILYPGENIFTFKATDDAENESDPLVISVVRDENIPTPAWDLLVHYPVSSTASATLSWTAPGSANLAEGAYYDLRFKTMPFIDDVCVFTEADWENANQIPGEPVPPPPQTRGPRGFPVRGEPFTFSYDFTPGTRYCFALKTFNGLNLSEISNVASWKINSVLPYVNGLISSHTTWDIESSPYNLGQVTIDPAARLTIEPGVVIKANSADSFLSSPISSLFIDGNNENPVVFTEMRDDSYAGDTNGDGAASSPEPRSWRGVILEPGDIYSQIGIYYMIIRYGGQDTETENFGNLTLKNLEGNYSSWSLHYLTLEYADEGLYLINSVVPSPVCSWTFNNNTIDVYPPPAPGCGGRPGPPGGE